MTLGPVARAVAIAIAVLGVLLCVMSSRAIMEARADGERARAALARGDVELAIVQLRSAARWAAPFNLYASDALVQLERLSAAADAAGDAQRALTGYRAIHAAIHATRSFYLPHTELLARADERIAALMAAAPPPRMEAGRSFAQRKADYLALLVGSGPGALGVLLACLGFVGWVGSAVVFLLWGVDAEGRVLRPLGRRSVVCLLVGWIAFAVGLRIA